MKNKRLFIGWIIGVLSAILGWVLWTLYHIFGKPVLPAEPSITFRKDKNATPLRGGVFDDLIEALNDPHSLSDLDVTQKIKVSPYEHEVTCPIYPNVKFQVYDRVLTDAEVQVIHKYWTGQALTDAEIEVARSLDAEADTQEIKLRDKPDVWVKESE